MSMGGGSNNFDFNQLGQMMTGGAKPNSIGIPGKPNSFATPSSPVVPTVTPLPGYSGGYGIPQFGRMSPEELAEYMGKPAPTNTPTPEPEQPRKRGVQGVNWNMKPGYGK